MSNQSFNCLVLASHQELICFYGAKLPELRLGDSELITDIDRESLQELMLDLVNVMTVFRNDASLVFETAPSPQESREILLSLSVPEETPRSVKRQASDQELSRSFALRRILTGALTGKFGVELAYRSDEVLCGIELIFPAICARQDKPKDGNQKTILLVEDEDFVRNVTQEVLESDGYRVITAVDGESGIRAFREYSAQIDLLLTDMVMPGMNGKELVARLVSLSPSLKAIFMSGYTENALVRQALADPRHAYLQKPFTIDALTRKIREVLESSPEPFFENAG